MSDLTTKAMLVSLSISVFTARRFDKKVTREVADSHKVSERAGRYNKNLFPFDLRNDNKLRQRVAKEAERIASDMSAFMGSN